MSKSKVCKVSPDEYKWQAEDDARTLMRAHEVMADGKRHEAARNYSLAQMEAMKKVVKSKPTVAKPVSKPTAKKK